MWQKLTAALDGLGLPCPSAKALRDLRRRIGIAPVKALFEVLAGPVAQPRTPGVRFGRFRTVAFDGCASIKVPDTKPNRAWLGKLKAALGVTGYPAIELMTLVETGTRALIGAAFGPRAAGETGYARQLLHLLTRDMLVLTDRGFDAAAFLEAVAATKAQFLARLTSTRRYHERWEHEVAYLALRHTLLSGRVYVGLSIPVVGVGVASNYVGNFRAVLGCSIVLAALCVFSAALAAGGSRAPRHIRLSTPAR